MEARVDWFDQLTSNMKKRMADISKQCKEVLAKVVMMKPDGANKDDVADNARHLGVLELSVAEMKKQLAQNTTKFELELMKVDQKVDKSDLEGLDQKTAKGMAALTRDLKIKQKLINKLMATGGGGSGDERSLKKNGSRASIEKNTEQSYSKAFTSNLPFMKMGDRISKFGMGYSKMLQYHQAMTSPTRNLPMSPNSPFLNHMLSETQVAAVLNKTGGDGVTSEMLEQLAGKSGGRRYNSTSKQSPKLNNHLKSKQDYKNLNVLMQNQQQQLSLPGTSSALREGIRTLNQSPS